jgi:hypothetical protein
VIYIEFFSRRPGVSLEDFHEKAGAGQRGWAEAHPDDRLLLSLGRTWRLGPEPEYLTAWWYRTEGLGRIDDWEAVFDSGDSAHIEDTFASAARIDRAGAYRELVEPVMTNTGPYYCERFDVAAGATEVELSDHFRKRRERHAGAVLALACVAIGRLAPAPYGLAFWQLPAYADIEPLAVELNGVTSPLALRDAAVYSWFGNETL